MIALTKCPPITFLGWARGELGAAKIKAAEAPRDPKEITTPLEAMAVEEKDKPDIIPMPRRVRRVEVSVSL